MDWQQILEEQNLSNYPVALGGCRTFDYNFDTCPYDVIIFDNKTCPKKIVEYEDNILVFHHASLAETKSSKLIQYNDLKILQDPSWDLQLLISKIKEKQISLFTDFAKNCLIESLFCCQKTKEMIESSVIFASCWQKTASYYLADAISALNRHKPSPSHMLDFLRKLEKNPLNEHMFQ